MIYDMLLVEDTKPLKIEVCMDGHHHSVFGRGTDMLNFFLTSKRMKQEAEPLFYGKNRFDVNLGTWTLYKYGLSPSPTGFSFTEALPPGFAIHLVSHLVLYLEDIHQLQDTMNGTNWERLGDMLALKTLRIILREWAFTYHTTWLWGLVAQIMSCTKPTVSLIWTVEADGGTDTEDETAELVLLADQMSPLRGKALPEPEGNP